MAESTGGQIVKYGLLGLGAWWLYKTFLDTGIWNNTGAAAPSPTPASPGAAPPAAPAAPATSAAPVYSGPSLATIKANLYAALKVGGDPDVTCTSSGYDAVKAAAGCQQQYQALLAQPAPFSDAAAATLGTCLYGVQEAAKANPPASTSCDNPIATYDVFNWYLANRANAGIVTPPDAPDHTTKITLDQYWAWVAPLLQSQIKGLSGYRGRGMGHFAEIARIVRAS